MDIDQFPPGAVVDGRYRIERRLGRGGFATVYEAEHLQLGRRAALKILEPVAPHVTERFQARFNAEARIAANLDHPNVVRIFDFGFIGPDERPYMAMELLDGRDLEAYLKQSGPIAPERARELFMPVLDALRLGHERGIVHKDLKPANLFLVREGTADERLVVLDFGIARIEGEQNPQHTEEGTYTGTPAYMAPEYIQRREVTPACDVYQLGLIFIEVMTGQPVVVGNSHLTYMFAHVHGNHRVPPDFGKTALGAALLRAIAVDPAQRYRNAGELLEALRRVRVDTGTNFALPAVSSTGPPPPTQPGPALPPAAPRAGISTGWLAVIVGALAVLGCVGASIAGGLAYLWLEEVPVDDYVVTVPDPGFDPSALGLDGIDPTNVPTTPTMPNIGAYSSEGQEMQAWLLSRYMILATLNQVTLYQRLLPQTGGWSNAGASFVPTGTADLLGLANQQLQVGLTSAPRRVKLETQTSKMRAALDPLADALTDLYDYHSVTRGWESDAGARGKKLTKQLDTAYAAFRPVFDDWSALVDAELKHYFAAEEDGQRDAFFAAATAAMKAQHQLVLAATGDPKSAATDKAMGTYDAALENLQAVMKARRAELAERYQITMGLHDRFLSALKDTRKQAGELRAAAKKGDDAANDRLFLWMQLHSTFDTYVQLQRF